MLIIDGKNMVKCAKCEGKKKIYTLGCLKKICDACNGKGWVEAEAPILDSEKKVVINNSSVEYIVDRAEDLKIEIKKKLKSKSQKRRIKPQKPKKRKKAKK